MKSVMVGMSASSPVLIETADKMLHVKKGIQQKRKQPEKKNEKSARKKVQYERRIISGESHSAYLLCI